MKRRVLGEVILFSLGFIFLPIVALYALLFFAFMKWASYARQRATSVQNKIMYAIISVVFLAFICAAAVYGIQVLPQIPPILYLTLLFCYNSGLILGIALLVISSLLGASLFFKKAKRWCVITSGVTLVAFLILFIVATYYLDFPHPLETYLYFSAFPFFWSAGLILSVSFSLFITLKYITKSPKIYGIISVLYLVTLICFLPSGKTLLFTPITSFQDCHVPYNIGIPDGFMPYSYSEGPARGIFAYCQNKNVGIPNVFFETKSGDKIITIRDGINIINAKEQKAQEINLDSGRELVVYNHISSYSGKQAEPFQIINVGVKARPLNGDFGLVITNVDYTYSSTGTVMALRFLYFTLTLLLMPFLLGIMLIALKNRP